MRKNKLMFAISSVIMSFGVSQVAIASDEYLESISDDESIYYEDLGASDETDEQELAIQEIMKNSNGQIDNKKLSQLRMEILKKKLEQTIENEDLSLLKIQKSRNDIQKQLNMDSFIDSNQTPSTSGRGGDNELIYNTVEEDVTEDYELISNKYNIDQNVGFLYKSKEEVMEDFMKSDEYLSMQAEKEESAKDLLGVIVNEEVVEAEPVPVTTVKLGSVKLDMLSVSSKGKLARLVFEHIEDDTIRKTKLNNTVTIKEGITFSVENSRFKVSKIDKNGVTLRDLNRGVDVIVNRGY